MAPKEEKRKSSKKSKHDDGRGGPSGCRPDEEAPTNFIGIRSHRDQRGLEYSDAEWQNPASRSAGASLSRTAVSDRSMAVQHSEEPTWYPPREGNFQLGPNLSVIPDLARPQQWHTLQRHANNDAFDERAHGNFDGSRLSNKDLTNVAASAYGSNVDKDGRQDDFFLYSTAQFGSQFPDQYPIPGNVNRPDPNQSYLPSARCEHGYRQWHCFYPGCSYAPQ